MEKRQMTPEQRIKRQIIRDFAKYNPDNKLVTEIPEDINAENLDAVWDNLNKQHVLQDIESEFKGSGEETDIASEWSRNYESKSMAAKLDDGTWVGWTYWYGGGKHGNPESIEWMPDAYILDVAEEEKMVIVRTFKKQ